jgi:hypothetical protein
MHTYVGVALAVVYLHMRSSTLTERVQAVVEQFDPVESATALSSKHLRNLENSVHNDLFDTRLPHENVTALKRAVSTHKQVVRDFEAFRGGT